MATNIGTAIEEHLKCPVCHSRLDDAKFLECGHSYCKTCIAALIRSKAADYVPCPYCRQMVIIRGRSVNNLKTNWLANNVIRAIESAEKEPRPTKKTCVKHPENEIKYYCERCGVITCSECAIFDHFDHGDRPKSVEEMIEKIEGKTDLLVERSNDWSLKHAAYENVIQVIKAEGDEALAQVKNEVMQEYAARSTQLELEKDVLIARVDEVKEAFDSTLDKLLMTEEELRIRVSQACILMRGKFVTYDKHDIISSYKEWAEGLEQDLACEVPGTDDAKQDLHDVKGLYFEKSSSGGEEKMDIGFIGQAQNTDGQAQYQGQFIKPNIKGSQNSQLLDYEVHSESEHAGENDLDINSDSKFFFASLRARRVHNGGAHCWQGRNNAQIQTGESDTPVSCTLEEYLPESRRCGLNRINADHQLQNTGKRVGNLIYPLNSKNVRTFRDHEEDEGIRPWTPASFQNALTQLMSDISLATVGIYIIYCLILVTLRWASMINHIVYSPHEGLWDKYYSMFNDTYHTPTTSYGTDATPECCIQTSKVNMYHDICNK